MGRYTGSLWVLADELLPATDAAGLRAMLSTPPLDYGRLAWFDDSLGGPSVLRINHLGTCPRDVSDRDVFRPLQYCTAYFAQAADGNAEWFARDIVQMSGLHLEGIVKRIGRAEPIPLGTALCNPLVRRRVPTDAWSQIE